MDILYTAYKFKLDSDTSKRPCGMNNLIYCDKKKPSPRIQRAICSKVSTDWDTVVFFEDDKPMRTIELW